jgi:hypothetical protein
LYQRAVKDL